MPWHTVNITVPLIILAAKAINDIVMSIRWRFAISKGVVYTALGVPVFFVAIWRLAFFEFNDGAMSFLSLWLLLAVLGLLLLGLRILSKRIGGRPAMGAVTLVIGVMMFAFTVRAGFVASYFNGDIPREILVYTQTSPDIADLAKELETAGSLTGEREAIQISIDTADGFSWPWQWYLRNNTKVTWQDLSQANTAPPEASVISVVNARNNDSVVESIPPNYTEGRRIKHRWWFPEEYRNVSPRDFFGTIFDRDEWRNSIDYFLYRDLRNPLGSVDSYVYYRNDIPLSVLE